MKHFVVNIKNANMLEEKLLALLNEFPDIVHARVLTQIYSTLDLDSIRLLTAILARSFNDIEFVGCSAMGLITTEGYSDRGTVISLTVFESSSFCVVPWQVNKGDEYKTSFDLINSTIKNIAPLKGVMLLLPVHQIDNEQALAGVVDSVGHVPVFGGVAGDHDQLNSTFVFTGQNAEVCSLAAIMFTGDNLLITTQSYLGWVPFGEPLEVTEACDNRLITIDNQPAYNLYQYYTGIEKDAFFDSALDFPFILTDHDGKCTARVPMRVEGEELIFSTKISTGEKLQFSFGDIETIFSEASYSSGLFKELQPDAIYVFSCAARLALLNEIKPDNLMPFKGVSPTIGFFTFGEIDSCNLGKNILNATIVSVAMKETNNASTLNELLTYKHEIGGINQAQSTRMSRLMRVVQRMTENLYQANLKLDKLAQSDPLTGCFNRRVFDEKLSYYFLGSKQKSQPLCLILLDIDKFKNVNDKFGHSVGDEVLKNLVSILSKSIPASSLLCRYGGEEFGIILPDTKLDDAAGIAEMLRQNVMDRLSNSVTAEGIISITCSFGVGSVNQHATAAHFCDSVDKMLFKAKNRGRNNVCIDLPNSQS